MPIFPTRYREGRAANADLATDCQELPYFCSNPLKWMQVTVSVPRLWQSNKCRDSRLRGAFPPASPLPTLPAPGCGAWEWGRPNLKLGFPRSVAREWRRAPGASLAQPRRALASGTHAPTAAPRLPRAASARTPDSRSYWLLPVANPRDRRRRAPPPRVPADVRCPAPAPALGRPPAPPARLIARLPERLGRCCGNPRGGSAAPRVPSLVPVQPCPAKVLMRANAPGLRALLDRPATPGGFSGCLPAICTSWFPFFRTQVQVR